MNIQEFLTTAREIPVVDVRTPAEFTQGHVVHAHNIPLFADAERARIGTIYRHRGREAAILAGLECVGPTLADLARQARELAVSNRLLVHCWRGGMRSASMAWLFETIGIQTGVLRGGYKAYRRHVLASLAERRQLIVLGGMTGSGKTDLLHALSERGEQILDLEAIADHRGSAFGALGQAPQVSNEHFENRLAEAWSRLNDNRRVWVEDESQRIGTNYIPNSLYQQIKDAPLLKLQINAYDRARRIVREYGRFGTDGLIAATRRIQKRLGGERTAAAIKAIEAGNLETATLIMLDYYDRTYGYGLEKKHRGPIFPLAFNNENESEKVEAIIQAARTISR